MNQQEKLFIDSIRNKIKKYRLKITVKEMLGLASGRFIETIYNDKTTELVDTGIEWNICKMSVVYFIERYCWIPFPGKGNIPFETYYFQREILFEAPDFKKLVFLKTRQCGISTLFSLYCYWKANFFESESIDVISTTQKKARQFVAKMEPTMKKLPAFLKTPIENKNQSLIKWENGSIIISESASLRAGRGDSLSLLVMDEAAHYLSDNLTRGIVSAAMPTLARTGGDMIIISTPNGTAGAGSYYYEQVNQLQISGNTKKEKLIEIEWYEVPDMEGIEPYKGYNEKLEKYIIKNYYHNKNVKDEFKQEFEEITENWRDNSWLRKQHEDLGDILFKQEIMHSFIVGENQVFPDDVLEKVKEEVRKAEILYENVLGKVQINGLLIWNLPIPKHRYIIGVDVGKGTSNDFSAIQVMDVENYEQVAEYHAKIGTKLFGRLVKKVAKFYNEAYVVIECNGIGEAVFNEVYHHDTDPYDNVYKQKKTKNGLVIMTGWDTNVKTRQLMTNSILDWFTVDHLWEELNIKSKRLYTELTTWVWKNNRPDHADGSHDDLIISFGLCLYLRSKAISFGESFLINDEGELIEAASRKELDGVVAEEDKFAVAFSNDEEEEDIFQKRHKCSKEEYLWLIK